MEHVSLKNCDVLIRKIVPTFVVGSFLNQCLNMKKTFLFGKNN